MKTTLKEWLYEIKDKATFKTDSGKNIVIGSKWYILKGNSTNEVSKVAIVDIIGEIIGVCSLEQAEENPWIGDLDMREIIGNRTYFVQEIK